MSAKDLLTDIENDEAFRSEIRDDFENEFNLQDLTVSEDLIARTMAAIRSTEKEETEEKTAEVKETTSENKIRNIRIVKWVSGIAAAVVIGVVGIVLFKSGLFSTSKSSDSATAPNYFSTSTTNSMGSDYAVKEKTESVDDRYVTNSIDGGSLYTPPQTEANSSNGYNYDNQITTAAAESYTPSADECKNEAECSDSAEMVSGDQQMDNLFFSLKSHLSVGSEENITVAQALKTEIEKITDDLGIRDGFEEKAEEDTENIKNMIRTTEGYEIIMDCGSYAEGELTALSGELEDPAELFVVNTLLSDLQDSQ